MSEFIPNPNRLIKLSKGMLVIALFQCFYASMLHAEALSRVDIAIGKDPEASYHQRHSATVELSSSLTPHEIRQLLDFLKLKPSENSLKESELGTLKNNIADKILTMKSLPHDFPEIMIDMLSDKKQGKLWQNYVLQKIPKLILRTEGTEQEEIIEILKQQAVSRNASMPGTALLGMERLLESKVSGMTGDEVSGLSYKVAESSSYALEDRITCLQIAARLRNPKVLALAQNILNDEKGKVMLKVSSLAVLGMVGSEKDLELINRYAKSPEYRMAKAAQTAMDHMAKRSPSSSQ